MSPSKHPHAFIALYLAVVEVFPLILLALARLWARAFQPPKSNPLKISAHECELVSRGQLHLQFNPNAIAVFGFNGAAAVKPRKAGGLGSALLVCLQRSRGSVILRFVRGHHRREWLASLSANARRKIFQAHPSTPQKPKKLART
jgi:hypothetical protein